MKTIMKVEENIQVLILFPLFHYFLGRSRSGDRYEDKGYEIQVKNLPLNLNWQNLKDAFRGFGNVLKADVEFDDAGKSKGMGYVTFERRKEALNAIENMHHAMFNGKELSVRLTRN